MDVTITLGAAEIDAAIKDYVALHARMEIEGDLQVDVIAGKGAAGHAAVVKIVDPAVEPEPKAKPKKKVTKDVTPKLEAEPEVEVEVSDTLKEATDDIFGSVDMPGAANDAAVDALFGA